jgi:hypothetical protein
MLGRAEGEGVCLRDQGMDRADVWNTSEFPGKRVRRDRDERSPTFGEMPPKAAEMGRELAEIRRRGYAVSLSQRIPHSFSCAAPVFGSRGEIWAALSVSIPEMRVGRPHGARAGPGRGRRGGAPGGPPRMERGSCGMTPAGHRPTGPDLEKTDRC